MKWAGTLFAAVVLMLVALLPAKAHESRPLHVQIFERSPDIFSMKWRVPASVKAHNRPVVSFPESCREESGGGALTRLFRCESGLSGEEITIRYPLYNPSVSTIIQLKRLSGETQTAVLGPDELNWRVPKKETATEVAKSYFLLGVEHILGGYDHLLFVACLVLIAGTWRRILITVTGFTIAHSITLVLAALGLVRVPVPPVEAAIALSIVFLATEIAREDRSTLTWRFPVAVSASFGLLHGFGFASALDEIGLPQTELLTALFFFNVGVEAGQILFVAILLAGVALLRAAGLFEVSMEKPGLGVPLWVERPAAYVIGALAAVWMVERIAGFWA
ncbi:MAG: HupE/UreJ family protein [Hyphomicrobiales bacterium]